MSGHTMPDCLWTTDGPPWHCTVCERPAPQRLQTAAAPPHRSCRPAAKPSHGPQPVGVGSQSLAPRPSPLAPAPRTGEEIAALRAICEACNRWDRGAPGCHDMPVCSRRARTESLCRFGRCKRGKWDDGVTV